MGDESDIRAILLRARAAIAQSTTLTDQLRADAEHSWAQRPCSDVRAVPGRSAMAEPLQGSTTQIRGAARDGQAVSTSDFDGSSASGREDAAQQGANLVLESSIAMWAERTRGAASRLAHLTSQHSATLRQLFTLRLQQLVLRKQQGVSPLASPLASACMPSIQPTQPTCCVSVEHKWMSSTAYDCLHFAQPVPSKHQACLLAVNALKGLILAQVGLLGNASPVFDTAVRAHAHVVRYMTHITQ
jgi:hypothetical protein